MTAVVFFVLAAVCVGAVLAMILTRTPAFAALFLVVAFVALAGLFGLLGAPFLAFVQVLVYAGAIMVLFVFVIMTVRPAGEGGPRRRLTIGLALALGLVVLAELLSALGGFGAEPAARAAGSGSAADLGRLLFTTYAYPFEIASVLVVAALAGAIVLTKRRPAR